MTRGATATAKTRSLVKPKRTSPKEESPSNQKLYKIQ